MCDAAALDAQIRALVSARAALAPGPAILPPEGADAAYRADNLLWNVRPAPSAAAIELGLYHPGLGWVTMDLSRAQIEDLFDAIMFALRDLPPTPSHQKSDPA